MPKGVEHMSKGVEQDKNKQRIWLIILYLVALVLLLRFWPQAGYGVAAITLLALLFKLGGKSGKA